MKQKIKEKKEKGPRPKCFELHRNITTPAPSFTQSRNRGDGKELPTRIAVSRNERPTSGLDNAVHNVLRVNDMQFMKQVGLAFIVVLALPSVAEAQSPVEADKHSCAELKKLIGEAGKLQLNARTRNPNGNEDHSLITFISRGARCQFPGERPSQWRIYAASNEICEDLYTCLPHSLSP